MLGADLTIKDIIVKNLIPVTIGNTIGGAFFVGTFYSASFGTLFDSLEETLNNLYNRLVHVRKPKDVPPSPHKTVAITMPDPDRLIGHPKLQPFSPVRTGQNSNGAVRQRVSNPGTPSKAAATSGFAATAPAAASSNGSHQSSESSQLGERHSHLVTLTINKKDAEAGANK